MSVARVQNIALYGIDSGIRHSVGGSDYGSVRVGAFMGLRIATSHGQPTVRFGLLQPSGVPCIDAAAWQGQRGRRIYKESSPVVGSAPSRPRFHP
jgi:hypothetical protein